VTSLQSSAWAIASNDSSWIRRIITAQRALPGEPANRPLHLLLNFPGFEIAVRVVPRRGGALSSRDKSAWRRARSSFAQRVVGRVEADLQDQSLRIRVQPYLEALFPDNGQGVLEQSSASSALRSTRQMLRIIAASNGAISSS